MNKKLLASLMLLGAVGITTYLTIESLKEISNLDPFDLDLEDADI